MYYREKVYLSIKGKLSVFNTDRKGNNQGCRKRMTGL